MAYDVQDSSANQGGGMLAVVTYYNKKSGKKMSQERASKADQSRVEQRIEYVSSGDLQNDPAVSSFSIAMPSLTDPMYVRWAN